MLSCALYDPTCGIILLLSYCTVLVYEYNVWIDCIVHSGLITCLLFGLTVSYCIRIVDKFTKTTMKGIMHVQKKEKNVRWRLLCLQPKNLQMKHKERKENMEGIKNEWCTFFIIMVSGPICAQLNYFHKIPTTSHQQQILGNSVMSAKAWTDGKKS